ncbi:MAG: MFS transporter [Myxococcota bacterium]
MHGRDLWTVVLLMGVMFTAGADLLVVNPTLPQMAEDLGIPVEWGSAWVTAYASATAAFALIFGPICDRFGRRSVLLMGLLTLGLGTGVCGFVDAYHPLVWARFVAGAGAGMLVTSTASFIGDHFDDRHRAIAMGWLMSGFFLSLIFGVPIGAFLAWALGWQNMFLAIGSLALTVLVVLALTVGHPRFEQRSKTLSLGSALLGYRTLLLQPAALGVLFFSASIGIAMTLFSVYTSPWLAETYGMSTLDRGLIYAVGGPALLIAGPLSGRWANYLGRIPMITLGTLLMAAMLFSMPWTETIASAARRADWAGWPQWGEVALPVALPTAFVFFAATCAGSLRAGPFMTLALEVVSPDRRGAMSALRNTFNHAGTAVGASVGALLWSSSVDPYPAVCIAAALTSLLGLVILRSLTVVDQPRVREAPPTASSSPSLAVSRSRSEPR